MTDHRPGNQLSPELAAQIAKSCVSFNIRRSVRVVSQFYDRGLAPAGLKGTQFSLLMGLASQKRATINRLAGMLDMDRTTLSRNARVLEKYGYLRLEAGEDRREQVLHLTEEGMQILLQAIPLWEKTQAEVETKFGQEWVNGFLGQLNELNRGLR